MPLLLLLLLALCVSHIGRSTHRNHQDSVRDLVVVSRVRLLLEVPPSAQPLPRHGTTGVKNVIYVKAGAVRFVFLFMFAEAGIRRSSNSKLLCYLLCWVGREDNKRKVH